MRRPTILTLFALSSALLISSGPQDAASPAAKLDPAEVEIGKTLDALYAVISGPADQARDWDKLKSLMHPDARLVPMGAKRGGGFGMRIMTTQQYIDMAGPMFEKSGFFEREVARKIERFGPMAHVFSTYESRHASTDEKPFQRGINSIQLAYDGKAWKILHVTWTAETASNPLPKRYL